MLSFVQQILAFATFEVLEPNWRTLETKLTQVTTVDQLLRDHVDFLDTCLKECMLTSSKLLRVCAALRMPNMRWWLMCLVGILSIDCDVLYIRALHLLVYEICQPSDVSLTKHRVGPSNGETLGIPWEVRDKFQPLVRFNFSLIAILSVLSSHLPVGSR